MKKRLQDKLAKKQAAKQLEENKNAIQQRAKELYKEDIMKLGSEPLSDNSINILMEEIGTIFPDIVASKKYPAFTTEEFAKHHNQRKQNETHIKNAIKRSIELGRQKNYQEALNLLTDGLDLALKMNSAD